jgi:hypothetical protein
MRHSRNIFLLLIALLLILACGTVPATQAPATVAFEPITIKGTYELHSDIRSADGFSYVANKEDLTVTFTATSQPDNTMKGTAQAAYLSAHEYKYEEEGYEPCHQLWSLEPIPWTAELTGTIQQNPDGSLTVALIANPKDGPIFTQNYYCEGDESHSPQFAYIAGVLVDGKYQSASSYQLGPMSGGLREERIMMEVVE